MLADIFSSSASLTWILGVWLLAGLGLEAVLARRQWRFLISLVLASGRDGDAAAHRKRVRYGQLRAVFGWLARLEAVLRLLIWLAVCAFWAPLAGLALFDGVLLFCGAATADHMLRQALIWLRWQAIDRRFGTSCLGAGILLKDELRRAGVHVAGAAAGGCGLLLPFLFLPASTAWPVSGLLLAMGRLAHHWARLHLIAPLFNRFRPLPAGELRDRLLAMTRRCGAHVESVFVVDQSRRSRLANAYLTGIGRNKRIVLFDTLVERLEAAELEAVMAHELGHDHCGHIRRYYALVGGLTVFAYIGSGLALSSWVPAMPPAVAILTVNFALPPLAWPVTPWLAMLRRRYEYEADAFAAEHASRTGLISALEKLLAHNLSVSSMERWYAAFYATHPPGDARLTRLRAMAQ